MDESSLSSLEIVAKHHADLDRPFLPAGHRTSNMLPPRLTALKIASHDIVWDKPPGGAQTVKYLLLGMRGLRRRTRQREENVKGLPRQVQ